MYKILIVDDEALETEALARILSAHYAGRCQIATAFNGKEAIATAQTLLPDVVLMDIEMPGINGLEAARIIREAQPHTRIVIVTAYEKFQYAQIAISLGAEDYLLKPIANANLLRLLDRVLAEIDADREIVERKLALDQLAQEQLVLSVLSGYAASAPLRRQLDSLGVAFQYGFFCAFKSIDGGSGEAVAASLGPRLPQGPSLRLLSVQYDTRYLVLALPQTSSFHGHEELERIIRLLLDTIRAQDGLALYASIGAIATGLSDLARSYETAMLLLSLCTPEQPVLSPASHPAGRTKPHKGLESKLYASLLEKDMDGALACVDTMLDTLFYVLKQPEAVMRTACEVLERVAQKLRLDVRLHVDIAAALQPSAGNMPSEQEMTVRIRNLLAEWMTALDAQPPARMQHIRDEIERYLQAHYAQDLSIKQVAKEMHYSEPYFSKLFSRCFHRNFVTYLTSIRMQAAREMLAGSTLSIREISNAVGFADANYFAKVFRKAYGISPTEYRRFAVVDSTAREEDA